MWYDITSILPAYVADPFNCGKYYLCDLDGNTWVATDQDCPNCTFWDQDKQKCVLVDDSCDTPQGAYYVTRHLIFQHAI